jgi:phage N-6-adenine-methyltransferase
MVDKSFWDEHSNNTSEWYTPIDEAFRPLNEEFHFETDISAEPTNRLGCKNFITKDMDALQNRHLWQGAVFSNPPYSSPEAPVYEWVKAAYEYAKSTGNVAVLLVRATPSVKWFHDFIWNCKKHTWREGVQVRYPPHRLRFIKAIEDEHGNRKETETGSPTFDSMIVIFQFHTTKTTSTTTTTARQPTTTTRRTAASAAEWRQQQLAVR